MSLHGTYANLIEGDNSIFAILETKPNTQIGRELADHSLSRMKPPSICPCLNVARTPCEHHGIGVSPSGGILMELRRKR